MSHLTFMYNRFWWRWVAANSSAELLGLGTVAAVGYVLASRVGEPHGFSEAMSWASMLVLLGAFEGLVVGWAQARVLKARLPELTGWVRASIVGAVLAWIIGMVPSTIMSLNQSTDTTPPPEIGEALQLVLAAGMGLVAGPILAFFQWRSLRHQVARAGWWLPANALAWAVGMPIIFLGAHASSYLTDKISVALAVGVALAAAGAAVGAIHGRFLLWLVPEARQGSDAA
jgi:hypothetical protein